MYYVILYKGKFGDTSGNQKMNRQYKKTAKRQTMINKSQCRTIKTKVIRTPPNTIARARSSCSIS